MRLILRRVKPSRRDAKKLTAFEKRTGRRYQIVATNIPARQGLSGVPGSGQVRFVDALYRDHAEVEDDSAAQLQSVTGADPPWLVGWAGSTPRSGHIGSAGCWL